MSWISDLAGKAENILNKIDQNAASVLKSENENDGKNKETKTIENSIVEGIRKNLSSSSLSLTKSLSPKTLLKEANSIVQKATTTKSSSAMTTSSTASSTTTTTTTTAVTNDSSPNDDPQKTEQKSGSKLSSRRSSISSKADTMNTVIECEVAQPSSLSSSVMIDSFSSLSSLSVSEKQQSQQQQQQQQQQIDINNDVEKELVTLRNELNDVTLERNQLKDENQQLQNEIKNSKNLLRIQELENFNRDLNEEKEILASELNEMKFNCEDYIKTITEFEINLTKAKKSIMELNEKLDLQTKENQNNLNEFEKYRKKAQTTLQMKDKYINELKDKLQNKNNDTDNNLNGLNEKGGNSFESDSEKILQMEIYELKQENSILNNELNSLRIQFDKSQEIIQQFEIKFTDNLNEQKRIEELLKDELNREHQKILQYESDVKILNQELLNIREEMNNERHTLSIKLHEKDKDIMKLKQQLSSLASVAAFRNGDDGDNDDNNYSYPDNVPVNVFEDRIKSLTQTLVKKQNAIETITAERNALKLQLEKTEDKIRQILAQNRVNNTQIVNINDTDDAKAQLPYLMRENPFDTNVTRRVKRAYSSLDSVGIRIGVFLRRYPLVRIMVIMYVAVLHLWVMFVLLSSTPS